MAAPSNSGHARSPESENSASRNAAAFGAIRTLRVLLIGTIIVPLLLAVVGGYLSYQASDRAAAMALAEAVAVAEENTTKILDTHMLVAARIDDLLTGLTDPQILTQEKTLHEQIAQQIKGLPQVAAAWVIDAGGHELVSARVFPVDRDLDHSVREDYRALRNARLHSYVSAVRARSLGGDFQPYFTVSLRRQAADGSFRGIVVVAVSGAYVASFYDALLGGSAQYAANVMLEDGTNLAHYPGSPDSPASQQPDELLAAAIATKATAGVIASGSPFSREGRLVAYERLANYPVYVTIERTRASIVEEWLTNMAGYAAIGIPAAIGLILLSLLALRRTRREQLALAEARDAITERAQIEAQLHQAQKMEAVGLLTAGIAHDFNNLLMIVSGNITLLEADLKTNDARRLRFIASAVKGCERASDLTRRLLSFARREPVDPQPVDINEVITRMSDLAWHSLGDRIAVTSRLSDDLWRVYVDPNQLETALLNLALNARDAMAGGGRLTIETANCHVAEADESNPGVAPGDHVVTSIGDTGSGMPPEVREKAFDPFFTTKEAGKGTGLGLSQVNGFVTRFGGHCIIDSAPGRGTTVKLYLPRYAGAIERGDADSAADEHRKIPDPVGDRADQAAGRRAAES